MNAGIVTSFIVGGILLVAMLTFNNNVNKHSTSAVVDLLAKARVETISELIINDFQKIGYNIPEGMEPFVIVQEKRIKFRADAFFSDNRPFSMITWTFNDNKSYSSTKNPNDFELTRDDNANTGAGNSEVVFPVTHFKLEYLDSNGDKVANPASSRYMIRQIKVEFICESDEPIGKNSEGEDIYHQAVWSKVFYPENLQYLHQ